MTIAISLAALSLMLLLTGLVNGARRPRSTTTSDPQRDPAEAPAAALGQSSKEPTSAHPASGMAGLKRHLAAGDWRSVLPALFVIGGLLGVMLFGAIALLIGLEQKVTGSLMLAIALGAIVKVVRDYRRA